MEEVDVIVIGAGAGGLVVAIGAASAGKKVVLLERGHWGGDCTNYGCIPSKALIAAGEAGHEVTAGEELGVSFKEKSYNADKALERVRKIVSHVRSHEDQNALEKKGVKALEAEGYFVSPHIVEAKCKDGHTEQFSAKKIVIAAGSGPVIPKIEGLDKIPYLTNETVFDLEKVPSSLIVLGGGPIGSELAQAFSGLGAKVSMIHRHQNLLKKEPPKAGEVIKETFQKAGIELYLDYEPVSFSEKEGNIFVKLKHKNGEEKEISAEKVLISIGRRPNLQNLQLEKANIAFTDKGIETDKYLRTSQKHIFAIGDITGPPYFTHLAENHGRCVLTSLLLPFKKKRSTQPVPRVTYTDPEIASVGLIEEEAFEKYGPKKIATYRVPFTEVDRALTQGRTEGFIEIVTKKWTSKILGATIVGPRAGEMLPEISLAMYFKIPLRKLSGMIHSYPTYNLGIRRASDFWLTQTILPLFQRKKHGTGKE